MLFIGYHIQHTANTSAMGIGGRTRVTALRVIRCQGVYHEQTHQLSADKTFFHSKPQDMNKHVNGQVFQHTFDVVALRPKVSENGRNAGKYAMRCLGDDLINPAGNFFLTAKQLDEMAGTYGLADWTSLPAAIARGGTKLHVTAQFCKEGEQSPEDPTIVYTTDWYRVTDSVLELGDEGQEYVEGIAKAIAVENARSANSDDRKRAASLRMAALLGRARPAVVTAAADAEETEEDAELDLPKSKVKK
jgi:hypothetical protein